MSYAKSHRTHLENTCTIFYQFPHTLYDDKNGFYLHTSEMKNWILMAQQKINCACAYFKAKSVTIFHKYLQYC